MTDVIVQARRTFGLRLYWQRLQKGNGIQKIQIFPFISTEQIIADYVLEGQIVQTLKQ